MPKNPKQAVCTLLYIFDQFSKSSRKAHYLQKYFMNCKMKGKDLGQYMLKLDKYKCRKDTKKLQESVYTFHYHYTHHFTQLAKPKKLKYNFVNQLSSEETKKIQEHMKSDEFTFPMPDHKFVNK